MRPRMSELSYKYSPYGWMEMVREDIIRRAKDAHDSEMAAFYKDGTEGMKKIRVRKPRPKYPTETQDQIAVAKYLDDMGYLWLHVPNEGCRDPRTAGIMKMKGFKKGAPDILIFSPRMVAVELKRPKGPKGGGPKVTPEQDKWLKDLRAAGWRTAVRYGSSDAIGFIEHAMGCPRYDCGVDSDMAHVLQEHYTPERIEIMAMQTSPLLESLKRRSPK